MSAVVRVADYPQVKAVLDAADDVVKAKENAEWDRLWTVSKQIDRLRERLNELRKP